jgi:hypothetical protein
MGYRRLSGSKGSVWTVALYPGDGTWIFTFEHTMGLNTENRNHTLDSGHENLRTFVGCRYVECFHVRLEWKSRKMFTRYLGN